MIDHTRILTSDCHDPHRNLAAEEALLTHLPEGEAILFLWQNAHTVVIGAGQNAWRECRTELLAAEGGTLARRSTGGGAVYHDLGNLNFSFIVPRADYDVARQLGVVVDAVSSLGVSASATGRNDVDAGGRKFSGNAFRLLKQSALHHGTLLCEVDIGKLARYLRVSPDKLKAKGVASVPARVVNLSDLSADATVANVRAAMIEAFMREYGVCGVARIEDAAVPGLDELLPKYEDWAWNYGQSPAGTLQLHARLPMGGVELYAELRGGALADVRFYTDAMDETLHERVTAALTGCPWRREALCAAMNAIGEPALGAWLAGEIE